jgi:biotin carboxylase
LEAFLEGPQLSVEGVFINGQLQMIAFADRNYSNLAQTRPYVIEDGGEIPSRFGREVQQRIADVMKLAAEALGIAWGSLKGDIVLCGDQPHVLEVAARLSGNYLASHHIPWVYGVNLVDIVIRLSLGEDVPADVYTPQVKGYLGVRYFFPPAGTIAAIRGVDEVKRQASVRMLDLFVRPGDVQERIRNHVARAGTIACFAESHAAAVNGVEKLRDSIGFDVRK